MVRLFAFGFVILKEMRKVYVQKTKRHFALLKRISEVAVKSNEKK